MKIEKINENQIRFTLSREDLASRQLRLSELAYGSDKARALFQELIQRASKEVGFEADEVPLMIEAIPLSAEGLVLLVTKVEDPEELDARFSNFTAGNGDSAPVSSNPAYADEIINCFEHLEKLLNKIGEVSKSKNGESAESAETQSVSPEELAEAQSSMARIYAFDNLAVLRKLSAILVPFYKGRNSLFKDQKSGYYYLVLQMSDHSPAEFNKVCNIVSEYGEPARTSYGTMAYFEEHFKPVLSDDALKYLAKL